jgi:hypothetical protein
MAQNTDINCQHEQFEATVNVNRITNEAGTEVKAFMADIQIRCVQCDEPFVVIAPVVGLVWDGPATSPNGEELRAPIRPRSAFSEDVSLPGFRVIRRDQ